MTGKTFVDVGRFEIVASGEGDEALVCFMGRSLVEEDAPAWLEGRALFVSRGAHAPLRFHGPAGLLEGDVALLGRVEAVYLNRTFGGSHELVRLRLGSRPDTSG